MIFVDDPARAVAIDSRRATIYCNMWRDFVTLARHYDIDTSIGEVLRDINRICRLHNMPEIEFCSEEEMYI